MIKTLGRFFGGVTMACGMMMVAFPAGARAQAQGTDVRLSASANSNSSGTHLAIPQTIFVTNEGTSDATGVVVTFTPPKGAKVDSDCLVDHQPGGIRSYTCVITSIPGGQTATVPITVSMTKPSDASFTADVTCDQGATASVWVFIKIS